MIYNISLKDLVGTSDLCKSPKIDWEIPGCPDIICGRVDSTTIRVEVPDHCVDRCVYVIVDCTDECGICEPKRIKVCPCSGPTDCASCETCVSNLCVSDCPDGWLCEDETCVECNDDNPCPDGKVCNGGKCVCPPDKPFMDSKGNCSDCNADNPCPPCYVCTPVGCVPVECQIGVCDPDTNECAECVGKLDCGVNECCVGGKCACCAGFVLNANGECIPDPGCVRDSDCGECYSCDRNNGCVPTVCPTGYIRIDGEPCCVKECDCGDPTCVSSNQRCIAATFSSNDPALADKCYCAPCNGACSDNGDCGPGCYCNGVECVPNTCFGACISGGDCGEGCGCGPDGLCYPCGSGNCLTGSCQDYDGCKCGPDDSCVPTPCSGPCAGPEDCGPGCGCDGNGKCVDCSTVSCEQCANIPGCACLDNQNCAPNPCAGPCAGGGDCGPGCGCLGGQCVPCSQYSCAVNFNCPNGCNCDANGVCQDNPCVESRCETDADCGFGCNCDGNGYCVPCPANDPNCGDDDCRDVKSIYADGCQLIAEFSTDACCACEDISAGVDITTFAGGVLSMQVMLRKGIADDYITFGGLAPLLGADIPTAGQVRLELVVDGVSKVQNINFAGTGGPIIVQFNNVPTSFISAQLYIKTSNASGVILGSGCRYSIPPSQIFNVQSSVGLTSKDWARQLPLVPGYECRNPIFDWYTGTATNNMVLLFSRASQKVGVSNGKYLYRDVLEQPDVPELAYGQYYGFRSDCGCDKNMALYSCTGPGKPATRYQPCVFGDVPETSIAACGVSVTLDDDLLFNCSLLEENPPVAPIVFDIYTNGVLTGSSAWAAGVAIPSGTVITHPDGDSITSLQIRVSGSTCPCTLDIPVTGVSTFTGEFTALPGSGCGLATSLLVNVALTPSGTPKIPYTATATLDGSPVALTDSGPFYGTAFQLEVAAAASGVYQFTITNDEGCEVMSEEITYDPILTSPFEVSYACVNSGTLTPQIAITVTNNSTDPLGATATFDGGALLPIVAPQSTQVYTVAANTGTEVFHIELVSDATCKLDVSVDTACCAIDPGWDTTITLNSVNGDGTINLDVTFDNTAGTLPARFGLAVVGGNPTTGIADDLAITQHVVAPGGTAVATYSNLSAAPASYSTYAQHTSLPVSAGCFRTTGSISTAGVECAQLVAVDLIEGFIGSGCPTGSVPTDSALAYTFICCYPGGSSAPPQVSFGNGATVNLDFFIDGVYIGMLAPGATGLTTSIGDFGEHTYSARVTGSSCPMVEGVYTPTCMPAEPPAEDDCVAATDRITIDSGFASTSPACANLCTPGNDICVVMCCGYSGNPSAPVMLLYNYTGFPVQVRRSDNNNLLVAASGGQTLAASGVSFTVNGSFDINISVDTGGDPCTVTETITWACEA